MRCQPNVLMKRNCILKCQLSIELNIRDLELLNWLCNTLGVGSVITRGTRPNMAIYRVSGKNDLLLVIIALIRYNGHSLLTGNRYWQFIQILDVLTSRVVFYNDLKLFDWNKPEGYICGYLFRDYIFLFLGYLSTLCFRKDISGIRLIIISNAKIPITTEIIIIILLV